MKDFRDDPISIQRHRKTIDPDRFQPFSHSNVVHIIPQIQINRINSGNVLLVFVFCTTLTIPAEIIYSHFTAVLVVSKKATEKVCEN